MNAFLRDPRDAQAIALVSSKDPSWNAMLRTTCVATMLDAGHATNALPQRARANVNCRIFPGVDVESVRAKLEELAADPAVKVDDARNARPDRRTAAADARGPRSDREAHRAVLARRAGAAHSAAGRDGWRVPECRRHPDLRLEPIFLGPDLGHIHGLNEYVGVTSLLEGREFLYRLVKIYAEQN